MSQPMGADDRDSETQLPKSQTSAVNSQCSSSCCSCQSLEDCTDLVDAISPDALLELATNHVHGTQTPAVSISEKPLSGSFNLVYVIDFADGTKCAARIPKHGTITKFGDTQAMTMKDELELLRVLREKTTVPVPEIYYYDTTFNNSLGAPFSLCSWLDGTPVCQLWAKSDGPTPLQQRRLRILDSVAEAMAQLSFLSHSSIGLPIVQLNSGKVEIQDTQPLRGRDMDKEHDYWSESPDYSIGDMTVDRAFYYDLGPFLSTADYLRGFLNNLNFKGTVNHAVGSRRLLRVIIDAIDVVERQSSHGPDFVLTHADLDSQNVMVSEDGSLTGLIDWDGIYVGPKHMGSAAYPSFITRDMNPLDYQWWSDPEWEKERAGSPAELRDLRKAYRTSFEKYAGTASTETLNSHLYKAVEEACKNKPYSSYMVTKLARLCLDGNMFDFEYEMNGETHKHYADSLFEESNSYINDEEEPIDVDWEPLRQQRSSSSQESKASTFYDELGESFLRIGAWIGLPFVVVTDFLITLWDPKHKQRTEEEDLLESAALCSAPEQRNSTNAEEQEVTKAPSPLNPATGETNVSQDGIGSSPALDHVDPLAVKDSDSAPGSDFESGHESDSSCATPDELSEAGSDNDIDPNNEVPEWYLSLIIALGQDKISDANIAILRDRFVEKFSSREVIEEWNLE